MSNSHGDDKTLSKDGKAYAQSSQPSNILNFRPRISADPQRSELENGPHESPDTSALATKHAASSVSLNPSEESEVVSFFSGNAYCKTKSSAILALHPENRGLKMVYRHNLQEKRSVAVPILCWGLREDGETVALVPWITELLDCASIAERFDVIWEGFYDATTGDIFEQPPTYISDLLRAERQQLRAHHPSNYADTQLTVQEIPDHIGTHAMLVHHEKEVLTLTAVVSWKLAANGAIEGMIADESLPHKYPILAGDGCLHAAGNSDEFRSFFQRDIAEQIRARDPETLDAIERLFI